MELGIASHSLLLSLRKRCSYQLDEVLRTVTLNCSDSLFLIIIIMIYIFIPSLFTANITIGHGLLFHHDYAQEMKFISSQQSYASKREGPKAWSQVDHILYFHVLSNLSG